MAEKLTSKIVKTVLTPGYLWDAEVKGLVLRVHPSGSKTFFLSYYSNGVERRHTIGRYPAWSLAAARDEAVALRRRIDRGEDPAGQRRERREAATVEDLVDRYIVDHLSTKQAGMHDIKIARQRANDEKRMLAEISHYLGKHTKVADVHFGDIENMHRKISESVGRNGKPRPVRANRILSIAKAMFGLSLRPRAGENRPWRSPLDGNPCKGVKYNHEEGCERFYSQVELAAISDALEQYPGAAADCVRLIMLTGARPVEAMLAKWSELDAEPGFWCKPSAHTKQRKVHKLPLSPPALELIDRLRKQREGDWVFPGSIPGEPLKALWRLWHLVRKHAGLSSECRIYDLRHTVASIGAAGGLSLPIIGRLLGHTQARTTQRYAHLGDDPVREAAEKIAKVIAGAKKPGAKVIGLKA
jgi:integrase